MLTQQVPYSVNLTWEYGVPDDSDVSVRRPHSRDMEHVRELYGMLFLLHPVHLNLAGGNGVARLVVVHTLSQKLNK